MRKFKATTINITTGKMKNPVKIAVLTDLHCVEYGEKNCVLIDAVRNLNPDIITIVGDMITYLNNDYSAALNLCRQLPKIAPTFYSFGNHEFDMVTLHNSKIATEIKKTDVCLLRDEYKTITVNGNKIDIFGLQGTPIVYTKKRERKINNFLTGNNFKLLLSHDPGHFDKRYKTEHGRNLIGVPIDVAICGHRHGGQVGLPFIGGLYMPDVGLFPSFTSGDTLVKNTHVVVSRGLGDHHRLPRINNPRELLVLSIS